MNPIPLNGQNIYTASASTGIPVEKLQKMVNESAIKHQKAEDKKWAIGTLGKDEEWYDNTMKQIEEMRSTLPDDLDYKEKAKKLYGWIAREVSNVNLSIPMEMDREYSEATCIELILTNPDMYLKILRWD